MDLLPDLRHCVFGSGQNNAKQLNEEEDQMMMQSPTLTPSDLIRRVAEETQCLMDMRRESMENGDLPEIPEEQDEIIQLYQNGITLIGKAWELQTEATEAREQLRHTAPDENEADALELTETQILDILWGLFDTTVRLEALEDRQAIYTLTQEIMDFHGLDLRVQSN